MTEMSLVLNNFIKNLFTTKSSEYRSLLHKLQASNPYSKTGMHFVFKYLSDIRVKNISKNFAHKMAAKTSWHRYGTKLRHWHPVYRQSVMFSAARIIRRYNSTTYDRIFDTMLISLQFRHYQTEGIFGLVYGSSSVFCNKSKVPIVNFIQ